MKTVLLAVDGMTPDQNALDTTLALCRRMLARLDVLQIIRPPGSPAGRLNAIRSRMSKVRNAVEDAMVTATFAEAGVPDPESALKAAAYDRFSRMLPEKSDPAVDYHCVVTGESTGAVIERYVHGHRDVVLTVFDTKPPESGTSRAKKGAKKSNRTSGNSAMPKLTIPLVLVKHAR